MPGGTTTNQAQNQTQNSSTSPWAAALPLLSGSGGILDQLGNLSQNNTNPTPTQTSALQQIESNLTNAPNFNPQVAGSVGSVVGSGPGSNAGILNSGYNTLQSNLNPIASGSQVGKDPALAGELGTIQNDVTNNLSGEFAAAGRPVGSNASASQAIARGVAQGEAPVIASQYNTDVSNMLGANSTLYNAAGSTASGLTGITSAGLSDVSNLPGVLNANPSALLAAGNTAAALPYQGLGLLESEALPVAALGATSTGSSTGSTQSTQQQPLGPTIAGGVMGGLGLLGSTGALGSAGWLAPLLLSDERAKTDIKPVGALDDGQNVYTFKYKADPSGRTHLGLLAQEVEDIIPGAVHEIDGVKFVDYAAATAGASPGLLNMAA
jgi:hypothetical protein